MLMFWGLIAIGSAALLARFLDLGTVPFILDEPRLALLLDHAEAANAPITHGLRGSVGIDYGPVPLWVYRAGRAVLGNQLETSFLTMAILLSFAILGLSIAIGRLSSRRAGAWAFALLSSSPFLFHYSRTAWDNPMQFAWFSFALLSLALRPESLLAAASAFFFLSLAFGTHLMSVFPALAIGLVVIRSLPPKRRLVGLFLGGIVFFAVNSAYLPVLFREIQDLPPRAPSAPSWKEGFSALLHWVSPLSFWGTDYFFNSRATILRERWGEGWIAFLFALPFGWILRIQVLLAALRSGFSRSPAQGAGEELFRKGTAASLFLFAFLAMRGLSFHPHYLLGVLWVPFGFAAAFLGQAGAWTRARNALGLGVLATNLVFVGLAHGFLRGNEGTRASHFSTSFRNLRVTVETLCEEVKRSGRESASKSIPVLLKGVSVFPPSLEWLSSRTPTCEGYSFRFLEALPEGEVPSYEISYLFPVNMVPADSAPKSLDARLVVRALALPRASPSLPKR